ncbi:SMI1/KNR4 family protein [Streptomyces sp. NBC_01294]|uniref:SMI1/KNR4 family protein n=1 Tax=Streptomyces sp. NBC_01294 TaxID=2903815 RepID=UPI002DD89A2C|nr:SMI1/KNR4 family protein [Streptomyces sp. NBC_01294]WRZ60931.1 SMI1/KNR4 family protein [Streptomyces sp. NBC_01294]
MNPAVAHLIQAIPPSDSPQAHNWARVEGELGTILPSDYKQLVDLCGGGLLDDDIWVLEPDCPNKHYDLVTENRDRGEAQQGLWTGGEPKPAELDAAGSRTIVWAVTENGDCLYWLARAGQEPEQWTVLIKEGRGREWEFHAQSCSEFLQSILLTGDAESEIFYDFPTEEPHEFRSSSSSSSSLL